MRPSAIASKSRWAGRADSPKSITPARRTLVRGYEGNETCEETREQRCPERMGGPHILEGEEGREAGGQCGDRGEAEAVGPKAVRIGT